MQYLILGLVVFILLRMAAKYFVSTSPATLARQTRTIGGAGALLIAAVLAARGALQIAGPLALIGFGLLNGGFTFGRTRKTGGQRSKVRTAFLELELDHDSGAMDGRVLQGEFAGKSLTSLDLTSLLILRRECLAGDQQSAQLIDAYLDRSHPDWRESAGEDAGHDAHGGTDGGRSVGMSGAMTREEAYEILGLSPGADAKAIHKAHRGLMKKLHPDQGGSTYLAAKINQAKDILLG